MKKGWEKCTIGDASPISNRKVNAFVNERPYFSTGAVGPEGELSEPEMVNFSTRPSRAGCMPKTGDVGFAKMKGTKKALLIDESQEGSLFSTGFCFLVPKPHVEPRFLFYFTTSDDFQSAKDMSAGSGIMGGIKNEDAARIQFPVPPLAEQQRIVGLLDKAFAGLATAIANAETNLHNAGALLESHLRSVFTECGKGWAKKPLGEICSLITDGKHGDCRNEEGSGYYFLSAKDVKNNTLNFDNARQIKEVDFEETHRRTNLEPNDICMVNTGATIGKLALAPDDPRTRRTTFQKSVAVIKPLPSIINNSFCCYHLKTDLSTLVNVSSGSAQKNLLIGDLKRHIISLPSLDEQERIVTRLDSLREETQHLENLYQQKIAALNALKKSLLHQGFTGEL
jgi:restriction endonuclease S subunit